MFNSIRGPLLISNTSVLQQNRLLSLCSRWLWIVISTQFITAGHWQAACQNQRAKNSWAVPTVLWLTLRLGAILSPLTPPPKATSRLAMRDCQNNCIQGWTENKGYAKRTAVKMQAFFRTLTFLQAFLPDLVGWPGISVFASVGSGVTQRHLGRA